jgi:endonuclease YncB( thermonuclease family)
MGNCCTIQTNNNETVKPKEEIQTIDNESVKPVDNELTSASSDVKEFSLAGQTLLAKVVYVYDGDTVHCVVRLNNQLTKFNCRLMGIDSPEIAPKNIVDKEARQQEVNSAIKSRNYLIERVTDQKVDEGMSKKDIKELCKKSTKLINIKCHEFDKYGRLLIDIYNTDNTNKSINMDMIDNKYAVAYDGGTKTEYNIENFS